MKKNVKILGAAAAALLAVAPVVASATTVNASTTTVNAGATTSTPQASALNINATLEATAGQTKASDVANSVRLSVDNGAVINGFSAANVSIIDVATGTAVPDDQALSAGTQYKVQVTGIQFSNLLTGRNWNLGNATFGPDETRQDSTVSSADLMAKGTFQSAPFYLTDASSHIQPYFRDDTGNQLPNGAVAKIGDNGEGVATSDSNLAAGYTADNILTAAKGAVQLSPTENTEVTTTAADIARQLADQNVALRNGAYVNPANGFHVTLTAVNHMSGKTVTVVVPFAGSEQSYANYPQISVKTDAAPEHGGFSSNFQSVTSQGKQSEKPSSLIRQIRVGSNFDNNAALAPFTAATADGKGTIDLSVLSNPVNTNVPGNYTVTVQATDWTTGKTSRLSYTVQVGDSDATYQNVNYPAEYGVNIWNIAGNVVSFSGQREPGQSRVATFDTKTVNGVEYTRINTATSNQWIQSQYLGNHSNNKPANNETKLNGTGRVNYNGKGSVRLLDANGHYVDQYVKKGSSFKVWAEKTVNGQHLYRIGSQSQWIPAKYFSLN